MFCSSCFQGEFFLTPGLLLWLCQGSEPFPRGCTWGAVGALLSHHRHGVGAVGLSGAQWGAKGLSGAQPSLYSSDSTTQCSMPWCFTTRSNKT